MNEDYLLLFPQSRYVQQYEHAQQHCWLVCIPKATSLTGCSLSRSFIGELSLSQIPRDFSWIMWRAKTTEDSTCTVLYHISTLISTLVIVWSSDGLYVWAIEMFGKQIHSMTSVRVIACTILYCVLLPLWSDYYFPFQICTFFSPQSIWRSEL